MTLLDDTVEEAPEVLIALEKCGNPVCFIYPNADAGSRWLIERVEKFAARRPGSRVLVNLDPKTYRSLLAEVGVLVGNSSSGIIESTSLSLPVVNVGIRQRGRDHARNVVDVPAKPDAIYQAVGRALTPEFRSSIRGLTSPYGEGIAARIITDKLVQAPPRRKLLFKNPTLS